MALCLSICVPSHSRRTSAVTHYFPVRLVLCDRVSEACYGCSLELCHLAVELGVTEVVLKCTAPKCAVKAAKIYTSNCGPLWVSRYGGTLYKMTKLLRNTVTPFVNGTVVPGVGPVSFLYRSVKTTTCKLPNVVFDNGNGSNMSPAMYSTRFAAAAASDVRF